MDEYWNEDGLRFPYVIMQDEKFAGFALVRFIENNGRGYFSIAEFFVLKKYRRSGIGKAIALQIFALHRGNWEVFQHEKNKPAQAFWLNVIGDYTQGHFTDNWEKEKRIQSFGN